jgi:crotonobetainyl-CoA:carnitine CoA-transferase CaiB-like acyl-CoA transferase
MGPLISVYMLTGELQQRMGSQLPYSVPRGVYQCSDGEWIGISASSDSVAARVMTILGVGDDPRFTTFAGRIEHRGELDDRMRRWCAQHTRDEAVIILTEAQVAVGPVFTMADIARDEHFLARGLIQMVEDTPMQGLIAHLSATPGRLQWAGKTMDADRQDIETNGWGTT